MRRTVNRLSHVASLFFFSLLPGLFGICQAQGELSGVLNHAAYTVCFTPGGSCTNQIVTAINHATRTLNIQAYGFTSAPIAKAILAAQKRKVKIAVLLDKSNVSSKYSIITMLNNHNIPFLIDNKPAIAHNKVMIIDAGTPQATVITGSFNFTQSAQSRNAENVIIIHSQPLANQYLANFNKRRAASESYSHYCMSSVRCRLTSTADDIGQRIKQDTQQGWATAKRSIHSATASTDK
jgi:phospholipase D